MRVETLANPRWPDQTVSVFLPEGRGEGSGEVEGEGKDEGEGAGDAAPPFPIVLFAHAYDNASPASYRRLLEHIASRGYAVILSPYMVDSERHADRYDALWAGFEAAVNAHAERLDLGRVGIVGHSYGAGAGPFLAKYALQRAGWGDDGAFLMLMAPWYPQLMRREEIDSLPRHLRVLVQVFEEDDAVDHRIAIDLFHALPGVSKDYVLVRSDARGGCALVANHAVPQSAGLGARYDALDEYGVFRLFDALAAYVFRGDAAGARVALGHGRPEQTFMGRWPDGEAVKPLAVPREPEPERPESAYIFRWSDREAWSRYGEPRLEPGAAPPSP